MERLSYTDYCNYSPSPLKEGEFEFWIKKAEKKFCYLMGQYNMDLDDDVKMTLSEFVDFLYEHKDRNYELNSYSNGVENFNFKDTPDDVINNHLFKILKENFPMKVIRCIPKYI